MLPIAPTSRCRMLEKHKTVTSRCGCRCLPATHPPILPRFCLHQRLASWSGFIRSTTSSTPTAWHCPTAMYRIGRISGYAPFHAYAVIHNQGRPRCHLYPPASRSLSRLTIPTIPRRQDGFKSELVFKIFCSIEDQRVSISFQAVEQETFPVKAEITLKPNEERIISDVEAWLKDFGLLSGSVLSKASRGPLVLTVEDRIGGGLGTSLSLGLRVSSLNKGGEYGVFFPAIPAEQESRSATWLFGLQQNEETRSNLAIVNLGNEPNRFTIELFDGKTGMQAGRVESIAVNPQDSFQLNSLLADYAPGVTQGYARVVPSNTEPFVTYAVIIDGARPGERTGDGSVVNSSP